MPWSSDEMQQSFQVLVNLLVEFHDQCCKGKNKDDFRNLRTACEIGLDLLYKEEMPEAAETVVASISGAIFTTLIQIGSKKEGSEGNLEFHTNLINATQACERFRGTCQNGIRDYEPDVIDYKNETRINVGRSMVTLLRKDELRKEIESLSDLPLPNNSYLTFFKRPAMHYPKLTAASGITGLMGGGIGALSILSHYVGPSLDILLHADQTGFTHQALIACSLLFTSIVLFSSAAYLTKENCPQEYDGDPDVTTALFRRV